MTVSTQKLEHQLEGGWVTHHLEVGDVLREHASQLGLFDTCEQVTLRVNVIILYSNVYNVINLLKFWMQNSRRHRLGRVRAVLSRAMICRQALSVIDAAVIFVDEFIEFSIVSSHMPIEHFCWSAMRVLNCEVLRLVEHKIYLIDC